MKTNNNNNRENLNSNKINDFGAKIGGARKDLFAAAHEWAAQLAEITPEALTKAGGVSKLVRLPNLESMTAAGAITADQARAALIIWRGIERKPAGSYRADRWAERTRARLEAAAAVITNTQPTAEDVADIINAARNSAEFAVLTAAEWPALPFSFGNYTVSYYNYSTPAKLRIIGGRYYRGEASTDPADIVRQLREMTAADAEQAAERRAAGPRLGVYMNRAGVYYIAPAERSEIVLQTYENRADALKAYQEDRAALVARYTALKNFPACRRDWNRPRVGEDWRNGENMTPEQFAAVLPFRGVEFGNWVNQTERAALLNSAFDGFHDLAAVLNIAPAAVTLGGSLAFAFASRGHSGAAAHYEPARRVINLTKKSGAGCMAHEWFHAVDNFAAGGGVNTYATESSEHPRAFAILQAIKRTAYYKRSQNLARFKGDYWTEGRELTARAFEGVCAVMLNAAGICSDFLVNCKSMDEFTAEDVARRSDYYPYPTADEAAALLPLYVDFLREVFGEELTAPAACYEEAKRAAERAEAERKEAERIAAERAEAERQERERKAAEHREKLAREAEEREQAAAGAVEMLREVLTARHFDAIATGYDSATAYAVAHLEGEIYTISADIQTANKRGRAYIESRPGACIHYKRVHNAKRIICRRWQVPEIRANNWNARELVEALTITDARGIVRTFCDFEKVETWAKAAELWETTQRAKAEQIGKAEKRAKAEPKPTPSDNAAPAAGLHLEDTADGVRVIGDEWRDTYFNKKAIEANGGHWNKGRGQWEATEPADVAQLRAWFALRDEEQAAPAADPTTLQQAGEITAPAAEKPAPVLPDWLRVGAQVRTRGRYMLSARTMRREWVEGEIMTVRAIGSEFVELENRDESGALRGLESVATATAAAELTPIYSASEKSEEPAAIAASYDTDEAPAEGSAQYYAQYLTQHADKGNSVFVRTGSRSHKLVYKGKFWDMSNADGTGTQYDVTTEEAADVLAEIYKAEQRTPLYEAGEITAPAESEPLAVAASYDTAEPANYSEGEKSQTPASDWAVPNIIAQARTDNPQWQEEFTTPEFYDRQGVTDEHGHRIKTAREIMDQARRIECNYMAGRGGLRYIAHRQERTKGANHPDTLRAYERLQQRARLLRAAELEAYRTAGEARRAAWYREHSQQADTLEQGGEITAPSSKPERVKTRGEVFAQYSRILHQLSDGKTWNDPQARHRAGVIINALNRYQDNFAKVPEIARLYNTHHFLEDGTDPAKAANEIPVPRSVYMGLSKPRRKSMQDVYKQADDLLRVLYFAPHCVDNSRRYNRIEAIQERYLTNIAQSLGYLSFETFSDFSSKTKPGTNDRKDADRDYTLKVNREDYAHPVNVERIRKAETWDELNPLRNSLYHQGARPCEGCPFAKGADFCPYTGGGTVEECKSRLIDTIKTEAA